ncbi:MAG: class I SAM-dependent methyltransferase [Pseudomonadota bacterium]
MPFSQRLKLAEAEGLVLPDAPVAVWGAAPDSDLSSLNEPVVISRDARVAARFLDALPAAGKPYDASVVILPREKQRARDWLASAAASTRGALIIDGQKTDGVEAHYKAMRNAGTIAGSITKAHGRLFWLNQAPDLAHWQTAEQDVEGFTTLPGIFSADKVDHGSRLLAGALPAKLGTSIVDLGAGWGWLSAQVAQEGREIHMVEADGWALECAQKNVPGATAHWADVLTWQTPMLFDTCIMNPPFHQGRKGAPDLGQAFIAKAAQVLKPNGQLFMVANRHLPYEAALKTSFSHVSELPGDGRYKLFQAHKPTRRRT